MAVGHSWISAPKSFNFSGTSAHEPEKVNDFQKSTVANLMQNVPKMSETPKTLYQDYDFADFKSQNMRSRNR